jgi:uncharacterized repeat protein (TIGR03803 family)
MIVHSFTGGSDGRFPFGGLALLNNTIYGTTEHGGSSTNCNTVGCGTVFFVTQHDFYGTVYSFKGNTDGAIPLGALLPVGDILYGTTNAGGAGGPCGSEAAEVLGCGTIFSVTPSGVEKVVYAFQGYTNDGGHPTSGLVKDGVWLYGTTSYGGGDANDLCVQHDSYGCGTVFGVTTGGTERVLHKFGGANDGFWPMSGLTLLDGLLYGTTTVSGNLNEYGTVFSITPLGDEKIVHAFGAGGGSNPAAPLTAVGRYYLFGTTPSGGSNACTSGCGVIFEMSVKGSIP